MTKQEAIKCLANIKEYYSLANFINRRSDFQGHLDHYLYKVEPLSEEEEKALDTAIEALKCEPTVTRCKELVSKEDFEEDYISKALTLEILNAMANVDKDNIKVYSKVYSQIKDIPRVKRKFGKWIPVSERLPEIGKVVLITCPFTICLSEHGNKLVTFDQWNGKEWTRFDGYVSAWQPLPEPYEEIEL